MSGCGTSIGYFRPAERAFAEGPSGRPAAEYELGREGIRWGEVRVWSNGTARRDERTELHVGFELENVLDDAIELDVDRVRVESLDAGDQVIQSLMSVAPNGVGTAAPHAVQRVDFTFVLPENVDPDDVLSFRVHWLLYGPEDWVYEQYTPFVEDRPVAVYAPSPWYFGFNFGYVWCDS